MRPTRFLPPSQDFPISLSCTLEVSQGGLLCLLRKGVQDVHSFFKLRHVEDPVFHAGVDPADREDNASSHRLPRV